jgi:purine-cytosine permease-like protein
MVNTIAGANILYDVGDGHLPESVAVLIIGLVALIVGLFGYKIVHKYERYSWIVMLFCFCIVAGFGAKHFVNVPMGTGAAETSSVLSFGTAIIGFQISWAPIAAGMDCSPLIRIQPITYTFLRQIMQCICGRLRSRGKSACGHGLVYFSHNS